MTELEELSDYFRDAMLPAEPIQLPNGEIVPNVYAYIENLYGRAFLGIDRIRLDALTRLNELRALLDKDTNNTTN